MSEWDLPDPSADPLAGLEEPDYSRFENVSIKPVLVMLVSLLTTHSGYPNSFDQTSLASTAVAKG